MEPTIITASGLTFNILQPTVEMIEIEDIAHALSYVCRFGGHTSRFYSVAEHSIECSLLVPQQHALVALMHDATEAYIGDVTSPLKMLLPEYREIEDRLHHVIFKRFGLDPRMPACIKEADLQMLANERESLLPYSSDQWGILKGIQPYGLPGLGSHSPEFVKAQFLRRFRLLQTPPVRWPAVQ